MHVTGRQVPAPIETFAEMQLEHKLSEQLIQNLASCGYTEPTPIQMQAIPIMSQGHSLLACAPTGSGKTATFLVPIVRDLRKPRKQGFRALILCPTRELAKQTQRECLRLVEDIGLRVHTLSKTNQAESRYGVKSNQKFDILVTTPNRVCHLLAQSPPVLDFSKYINILLKQIKFLIKYIFSTFHIVSNGWCWTRQTNSSKRERNRFAVNSIKSTALVRMPIDEWPCSAPRGRIRWPSGCVRTCEAL